MDFALKTDSEVKNFPLAVERNFVTGSESLGSLPYTFDRRHYKKDSRFVNDLYTLTYDEHESLDTVRLFSSFANQVSGRQPGNRSFPNDKCSEIIEIEKRQRRKEKMLTKYCTQLCVTRDLRRLAPLESSVYDFCFSLSCTKIQKKKSSK